MHARREEERHKSGGATFEVEGRDGGMICETKEEGVHGRVPVSRELAPVGRVPPVRVEAAIGEEGELREGIKL